MDRGRRTRLTLSTGELEFRNVDPLCTTEDVLDDRRLSYRRWRQLRLRILDRDGRVCWICGRPGADTVDHVVPRARGGTDHPSNLRAAHSACNTAKHDRVAGVPITSRSW